MLSINDTGNQPIVLETKKTTIHSERAYIVSQFLDEINKERIGTKWKPLSGRACAITLSTLKTNQELYEFFSICRDYKNRRGSFGKRFFGAKIKTLN